MGTGDPQGDPGSVSGIRGSARGDPGIRRGSGDPQGGIRGSARKVRNLKVLRDPGIRRRILFEGIRGSVGDPGIRRGILV